MRANIYFVVAFLIDGILLAIRYGVQVRLLRHGIITKNVLLRR